jgi:hypothetical protein
MTLPVYQALLPMVEQMQKSSSRLTKGETDAGHGRSHHHPRGARGRARRRVAGNRRVRPVSTARRPDLRWDLAARVLALTGRRISPEDVYADDRYAVVGVDGATFRLGRARPRPPRRPGAQTRGRTGPPPRPQPFLHPADVVVARISWLSPAGRGRRPGTGRWPPPPRVARRLHQQPQVGNEHCCLLRGQDPGGRRPDAVVRAGHHRDLPFESRLDHPSNSFRKRRVAGSTRYL